MDKTSPTMRFERRWPVAVSIILLVALLEGLPDRIRLAPPWVAISLGLVALVPMFAVGLTSARARWLRFERIMLFIFIAIVMVGTLLSLGSLVSAMVRMPAETTGMRLLASSVAVWATTVLTFSLLFWQMDRGGPESRLNHVASAVDWLFPQETAPQGDVPANWGPDFVDYFYLGFSTATCFSASYAMPLSTRAKLLMTLQGLMSLATIVLVGARAVNVLGS